MYFSELLNVIFRKEIVLKNSNNWESYQKDTSGIATWLFVFLILTVFLALIFCFVVTIIAITKTKRKVKEFNEQKSLIDNSSSKSSIQEVNKNQSSVLKSILFNIKEDAKNKDLLNFELMDIKTIKIKIVNYLKKNNITTIGDLVESKESEIKKLISNFPNLNSELTSQEEKDFIAFLNQVRDFTFKTKEK